MPRASFDVAAFLDSAASIRFSVRILVLCGTLSAAEGLDQYIVASTLPALASVFAVKPAAFATVFVMQALGQVVGTYALAPLADRFGRRPVILACTLAFGLITLLSALAATLPQFAAVRFISFVFLGGALPNLFAITAEFASSRNRQRYLLLLGCVHGLGAGAAGLIGARLLVFGWQMPLLFCGALTCLIGLLACVLLAESPRFLTVRPGARWRW